VAVALAELNFNFDTDIEKVVAVLKRAHEKLAADAQVKPSLIAASEICGWIASSEWSVIVQKNVRVMVGKLTTVARLMNQFALTALQDAGIPVESYNRSSCRPRKNK
jgi:hypothetical protein